MKQRARTACCIAVLFGPTALAQAMEANDRTTVDAPTVELLEYLAEFEPLDDGRLLDPLDLRRPPADDNAASADQPRSTLR